MTLERADEPVFPRIIDLDEQGDSAVEPQNETAERSLRRVLNVGHQAVSDTHTDDQPPVPLPPAARSRLDELFNDPLNFSYLFSRHHGLSIGDIDALVKGLNELHGEFDDQDDTILLTTCFRMLLRGMKKVEIASEMGLTTSEVNRMTAFYMRNVRMTVVPHREESVQRMKTILEQDRAETGRRPAVFSAYTPPQPVKEIIEASKPLPKPTPAPKPVPARKSPPPKKAPAKKVQPVKPEKISKPPRAAKKKAQSPPVSRQIQPSPELDLSKNHNLFTRALLRPDVDEAHFDRKLSSSLSGAFEAGVIAKNHEVMLLNDLSYGLQQPAANGIAHEARAFVYDLGKQFPGRLADDSLRNINVMRGLFSFYGQKGIPVSVLEQQSHAKVPVRLLVAGAVTEILDSATRAKITNLKA